MERLRTKSAQVEDLCPAIVTPELRSMADPQPDASLKAKTMSIKPPEASQRCSNNPLFTEMSLRLFYEYGPRPSCSIT